MKLPILILSTAVMLTASVPNLRADPVMLISNLSEEPSGAAGFYPGQFHYTVFKTGAQDSILDSVTLEHFLYNASQLPTVRILEASDALAESLPQMTLVCSLGNPQPLANPGWLGASTFVSWSPSTPVTLKAATRYVIAAGGPVEGDASYFVVTDSSSSVGFEGWQVNEDYEVLSDILWSQVSERLICKVNGSVVAAPVNLPPDISNARSSTTMLWPPTGNLVPFTVVGVTDPDGDAVRIQIDAIEQDEPVKGSDYGAYDAVINDTPTALVRADRDGAGNGRVYRVSFTASDDKGGKTSGAVFIGVPHSTSAGPAVDDGSNYTSTTEESASAALRSPRSKTKGAK